MSINIIYINQIKLKFNKNIRVEHFFTNLKEKKEGKRKEKDQKEKETKCNKEILALEFLFFGITFERYLILFLSTFRKRSTIRSASQWKRGVVFRQG